MTVPTFQAMMKPALESLAKGQPLTSAEVRDRVADLMKLSVEDRETLVPSGTQSILANRAAWALIHMERAAVVKRVSRGVYQITDRGAAILRDGPDAIDMKFLYRYPEYVKWRAKDSPKDKESAAATRPEGEDQETPAVRLGRAVDELQNTLEEEILETLKSATPAKFEQIVIALIAKMGYGGSYHEAVKQLGGPGDGGIDGEIKQDRLGFDVVFVQAKRWEKTVPAGQLRDFIGALDTRRAKKGVFITTSDFPRDAKELVSKASKTVVLIDGEQLAKLLIEFDLGVLPVQSITLKRIDPDFFAME